MLTNGQPVLVTGAAGFIGCRLVTELHRRGVPVTGVDRVPWRAADRLHPLDGAAGFTYRRLDLEDDAGLAEIVQDHSVVFHLSANTENRPDRVSRLGDLRDTVGATVFLLEALARSARPVTVVLASSQLVYAADPAHEVITERIGTVRPVTRFAAGKASAEAFLSAYAHELGWRAVACRLSNIVGPQMRRGIVPDIVGRLGEDPQRITLLGDGRQTRSYLHVDDCVEALIRAADSDEGFSVLNVCNTDAVSAAEVAAIVAEEFPGGTPEIAGSGGNRGWAGDLPTLRVHPEELLDRGWRPARGSAAAVRATARAMFARVGAVTA